MLRRRAAPRAAVGPQRGVCACMLHAPLTTKPQTCDKPYNTKPLIIAFAAGRWYGHRHARCSYRLHRQPHQLQHG